MNSKTERKQQDIGNIIAAGLSAGTLVAYEGDSAMPTDADVFDTEVRWAKKEVERYLWERAESPEVVEAMYKASVNGVWGDDADTLMTGRQIVQRALEAGMTALIGPRPEGENDAN